MKKRLFAIFVAVSVVTALVTSGVWLTTYFVAIKPKDAENMVQEREYLEPLPGCSDKCSYEVVESMPIGIFEGNEVFRLKSTSDAWKELLQRATKTVEIAAFYWSLLANNNGDGFEWDDSAQLGTDIYNQMLSLGEKGVKFRLSQDGSRSLYSQSETKHLADLGFAEVYSLNFTKWFGAGVLHTKVWVVDGKHFYLGSANQDWRSLTQVKELGVVGYDCPCWAADLKKILHLYEYMGIPGQVIPPSWPLRFRTSINSKNPLRIKVGTEQLLSYFTSSPPGLNPFGRADDGDTIVRLINEATEFIYISVMDYAPFTLYNRPNIYWPQIDTALRKAAFDRQVKIRLIMSKWPSTRAAQFAHLHSLQILNGQLCQGFPKKCGSIDVKIFQVPPYKVKIPFGRVNHAKYIITEKSVMICTSNWSADYFISTGGISLVTESGIPNSTTKMWRDVKMVHERDWESEYSTSIMKFDPDGKPRK